MHGGAGGRGRKKEKRKTKTKKEKRKRKRKKKKETKKNKPGKGNGHLDVAKCLAGERGVAIDAKAAPLDLGAEGNRNCLRTHI
jgi:hypothetical protein